MMGRNYKEPNKEMQIDMTPNWMNVSITIIKWFMYIMPFVCSSIALIFLSDTMSLGENYLLTAVYGLSMLKLWDLVDSK